MASDKSGPDVRSWQPWEFDGSWRTLVENPFDYLVVLDVDTLSPRTRQIFFG